MKEPLLEGTGGVLTALLTSLNFPWQMESVDIKINGVTTQGQTHDVEVCN
jgi:hypothetical protein